MPKLPFVEQIKQARIFAINSLGYEKVSSMTDEEVEEWLFKYNHVFVPYEAVDANANVGEQLVVIPWQEYRRLQGIEVLKR